MLSSNLYSKSFLAITHQFGATIYIIFLQKQKLSKSLILLYFKQFSIYIQYFTHILNRSSIVQMNSLNQSPKSSSISQRVFALSQKINHYNSANKPLDTIKKCQNLESFCDQLQNQMQKFKGDMTEQLFDVKSLITKIQREVSYDYTQTDNMLRQQIDLTTKKVIKTIDEQNQNRKIGDARLLKFIDQQTAVLRELIEKQSANRQSEGENITQSLDSDINEINQTFQEANLYHRTLIGSLEKHFYSKCYEMQENLTANCEKYSQSEAEFYKLLRDLVKKVKEEIQQHQCKREETEGYILNLIEKMCDKVIQRQKGL